MQLSKLITLDTAHSMVYFAIHTEFCLKLRRTKYDERAPTFRN